MDESRKAGDKSSEEMLDDQNESVEQQQNSESDSGEEEMEMCGDGSLKPKQKRRSKNDFQGRDHKCTYCDKTYLSYPALYTHMKNKHAKGPDGQPLVSFNSGRGRGRPKKNSNMYPMSAIHNLSRPQGASMIDPTLDLFFSAADKKGGPTDILSSFQHVYTEIYIRKANKAQARLPQQQQPQSASAEHPHELGHKSEDDEQSKQNATEELQNPSTEPPPIKKKRGRKPKSYYEHIAKQEK